MLPVSESAPDTQATGTGVTTESSAETKTEKKSKVKPEVAADTGLLAIVANYDDAAEKAQSFYVEMIQYIKKNNISRAVLVKTLMEGRKIEAQTAVTQASRILTMAKDEGVVAALAAGEITLKVAREQTKKTRESSKASTATGSNEGKDQTYDKALKAFAAAAKALGYPLKDILASVKATLQAEPFSIK